MKIDTLWEEYKKELDRRKDGSEEESPPKPIPTHVVSGGYNVRY